jgi:glycosyltransferase involved in cell wall biosynthesis
MQIQAELVFATSTPLTIAIPAIVASKRQRIPMVFEVRDLWPEVPIAMGALRNPISRWLARKLERVAYRSSARVIALSQGMADGVARVGFPIQRIVVVPNASDISFFRNCTTPLSWGQEHLGASMVSSISFASLLALRDCLRRHQRFLSLAMELSPRP